MLVEYKFAQKHTTPDTQLVFHETHTGSGNCSENIKLSNINEIKYTTQVDFID